MRPTRTLFVAGAAVLAVLVIPALIGSCARRGPRAGGATPTGPTYGDGVIGDPIVDGALVVYPVMNPRAAPIDVLTFDEAVAKGLVVVTERGGQGGNSPGVEAQVSNRNNDEPVQGSPRENRPLRQTQAGQPPPQQEAGQTAIQVDLCGDGQTIQLQTRGGGDTVNTLLIENRSDKPVFIMAGEIVKGGRQDRTIAQDSIIPPKSGPVDISVFCVEHGRWQGQSSRFDSAGLCADNSVRQKALVMKGQSQVWQAVAEKNDKVAKQIAARSDPIPGTEQTGIALEGAQTGTYLAGASHAAIQKRLDERLATILSRLSRHESVTGFVVALNGTVVGADIFAGPSICAKMQEKLLKSYVYDAETSDVSAARQAPSSAEVAKFLNDVAAGKATIERRSRYGLNRANENDVAALYVLQDGENGAKLHECLQRK
ncbi:MAG: hypothetical protein HYY93_14840 [Planctomycetes bacterium]|nr:hypothetical protein [Planctomycetota bacterium]